jgi:hypothetical protein
MVKVFQSEAKHYGMAHGTQMNTEKADQAKSLKGSNPEA